MPREAIATTELQTGQNFVLLLESTFLKFYGSWALSEFVDLSSEMISESFDFLVKLKNQNYLIHAQDIPFVKSLTTNKSRQEVNFKVKVISSKQKHFVLEANGYVLPISKRGAFTFNSDRSVKLLTEQIASLPKIKPMIVGSAQDVTDIRNNEQELKQNKELLQSIINAPELGITVFKAVRNNEGKIIDFVHELINYTALKKLGEDLTGRLVSEQENQNGLLPNFTKVIETNAPVSYLKQAQVEGNGHWISFTNAPLGEDRLLHTWADVTGEKKTDHEILQLKDEIAQKATDKYYSIFNSIDEGFCIYEVIYDTNGEPVDLRWLEVNPAYQEQTGLRDVVGKLHSEVSPGTENYWLEIYNQVVKTGEAVHFENWHEPTGRWYNTFSSRIGGEDNRQVAVLFSDITERKCHEERQQYLLELSDALRELNDPADIQLTACRILGEHVRASRVLYGEVTHEKLVVIHNNYVNGATPIIGTLDAEQFGRHTIDSYKRNEKVIFTDARTHTQFNDQERAAYASINVVASASIGLLKGGRWVATFGMDHHAPRQWTSLEISLMEDTAERIWTAVEAAKAETALRQAEETYRKKLEQEVQERTADLRKNLQIVKQSEEAAEIGSWEYSSHQDQFTWSDGMYRIFALPINATPKPEMYINFAVDEDREIARHIVDSIKHHPKPFDEIVRIKTNGKVKTLKVRATVSHAEGHTKVLGVDFDVTALAESEKLKELNQKLKELDLAKTNFFSNISHEFRTPITLLMGPIDDILKGSSTLSPQHLEKLRMAKRNAFRLQKLVNSLLDFSRFEAGQADAIYQPTDIVKYTTDLAGNFRSMIEEAGLKLIIKTEDPGEQIYLNRSMYEKIVLNLLSNAFKFTFKGKIEVKILNKNRKVELRISDTGVGIDRKNQSKIFERFTRIESQHSRTFEGSGIGLALVKEMVKMHHGSITLKSELKKGSTFIVTFLKGKDLLDPEKIFESRDVIAESSIPSYLEEAKGWLYKSEKKEDDDSEYIRLKPTILLADDNEDMRSYLSIILQPRYHILQVNNGKEVWEIIKSGFIPDLVLADVMMPEMDGYELLDLIKLHESFKTIPVILLSARADEDSRIEGMHSGADDYLVKPFSSRELIARIDARIQISSLQQKITEQLTSANEILEKNIKLRTEELRASNESLERKNHELTSLNNELAAMTFAASHDLKEPLRKLNVFANILARDEGKNLTDSGRYFISKIKSFVELADGMVTDIGTYAYVTTGTDKISTVDINTIYKACKASLKDLIQQKNAVLQSEISGSISGDGMQIRHLIYHLILNALTFQHPDRIPHIRITGKNIPGRDITHPIVEKNRQYYEIAVHDNGIGFEQKFENQIFQLFRKLHKRTEYPGSGVGLSICKKIVENHKGSIYAVGVPDKGSSFYCYFPIH